MRKDVVFFTGCLLFTAMLIPVMAQPTEHIIPNTAFFNGAGSCDQAATNFTFRGGKTPNTRFKDGFWHGSGTWVDEDWSEGILVADFTVSTKGGDIMLDDLPGHITYMWFLYGQAKVYIDGQFIGTYLFTLSFADGTYVNPPGQAGQSDWISFSLYESTDNWPNGPFYYQTGNVIVTTGHIISRFTT